MRVIVSNTGPILHLAEAQALELLRHAGEVCVPEAVALELEHHLPDWGSQRPQWILVVPLDGAHAPQAKTWRQADLLDAGEAQAVALARQLSAQWFLTDDAGARLFAQSQKLETHGSLGVLLWAAAKGYLDRPAACAALERLARSSLWLSARVLAEATDALDQLLP